MADFFKGLAGGFGTGLQLGQAVRERNMRDELAQAYAKPETYTDYTPEQTREIQRLQETGAYDVQAVPGAEGTAPTLRYTPRQGLDLGQGEMPAAPTEIAPGQVQRYGGRTTAGQFNPTELRGLQMQEAARVLGSYGDVRGAAALQAQAEEQAYQAQKRPLELAGLKRQAELGDIQLTDAQRKQRMQVDFDNGFAEINKQTFEKPEDRTAAILSLVEKTQGVTAAEQLRSSYSQNELNQISIQSKKFDEGFRQSRAKGVIPALEWFDEQNTSFKLERDPKNPFRYIQVNQDGTRSVFADAKNERELGMIIDAKAKPGGFLELAKYDLDVKKADAAIASEKAKAGYYAQGGRQTPVVLVNDKGEPTPVYMDRLPVVNGVVQLPQGLRMPKDAQQATAAQNRAYEVLTKTDAWERAERAGDTATMNKLLTNRGLDPAQFGGIGMKGWGEQGGAASQTTAPGQPAQQSMAAPARAPSAGLMTPQQLAAAQQQQQAQTQEQQQQDTAAGVRASGLGREALMLREEAAGYTPIIIQQMTPRQADELRRRYGRYLTPEQMRAVNQAM
jgi:hypothetical protein